MSKLDKKQRHRAKRDEKRRAVKRRQSISPIQRLAQARGAVEYWMSEDFELNGQMQLFVYKQAAGLNGIACFLIDRGIVGLKDAWTRVGITRREFDDAVEGCNERGIRMRRATIEEVRRWVAGGMRWAHENGMRLPKDWAKTVLFIGGAGDWKSAELSGFIKEFAGHPHDLRQRLIGQSIEDLLKRDDIKFEFNMSAPVMDQQTGEYAQRDDLFGVDEDDLDEDEPESIAADLSLEELNAQAAGFTPAATALAAETANWSAARSETPSPQLLEAWRSVMLAAMLSKAAMPDAPDDDVADFGYDVLKDVSARIDGLREAEHDRAVGQILNHLQTNPLMMQKAVLKYSLAGEADEPRDGLLP